MAAENQLKGVMEFTRDAIVSSDIVGNAHSVVFDSLMTKVLQGNFVQIVGWYDNEYGYSNRVVDLIELIREL